MIKAIIFDAFGTLFNLDHELLKDIKVPVYKDVLEYARSKQLSYTWLYSLMGKYESFETITRLALSDGCKKYGLQLDVTDQLERLYFKPKVFDDVIEVFQSLQSNKAVIGILSNGTHNMLQSGIKINGLEKYIDKVFSADDIKVYKPDPKIYALVIDSLHLHPEEILFVSSNQWDVAGASSFGFQVAWVNREGAFKESLTQQNNVSEVMSLPEIIGLMV